MQHQSSRHPSMLVRVWPHDHSPASGWGHAFAAGCDQTWQGFSKQWPQAQSAADCILQCAPFLSTETEQPQLSPVQPAASSHARHIVTCEPSNLLDALHPVLSVPCPAARLFPLCSMSFTPSPSTVLRRHPFAPLPAASWSSCARMASPRRRPASSWSRSLSSELGDAIL